MSAIGNAVGKVVDVTVVIGSTFVGVEAVKVISNGIKTKNTATTILGSITLLIGIYAFKEAVRKLNE
jgi:uncharacterized membrane protein YjjP (DUF1212 family)